MSGKINSFSGMQSLAGYGIISLMLVGVIAGAIGANLTDTGSHEAIKSYLAGFFVEFDKNSINLKATLIDSFYKYARIIAVVWVSGFFSPGIVIVVGIILFKSFAYGFTTAALVKYFGFYGFVIGFGGYIPQNLFFLPALFFVSRCAFTAVLGKLYGWSSYGSRDGRGLAEYLLILLTGLLCCAVAALTEAYLTPVLLEYVKPL